MIYYGYLKVDKTIVVKPYVEAECIIEYNKPYVDVWVTPFSADTYNEALQIITARVS